MLTSTS